MVDKKSNFDEYFNNLHRYFWENIVWKQLTIVVQRLGTGSSATTWTHCQGDISTGMSALYCEDTSNLYTSGICVSYTSLYCHTT